MREHEVFHSAGVARMLTHGGSAGPRPLPDMGIRLGRQRNQRSVIRLQAPELFWWCVANYFTATDARDSVSTLAHVQNKMRAATWSWRSADVPVICPKLPELTLVFGFPQCGVFVRL